MGSRRLLMPSAVPLGLVPMVTETSLQILAQPSRADAFMRRLLRVGDGTSTPDAARKAMQTSLLISTVRCTAMYVVLPFVAPALGWFAGVSTAISIVISIVAMGCIVMSMRRFWRCNHPSRWAYTAFGGVMFVALAVLLVRDVFRLIG